MNDEVVVDSRYCATLSYDKIWLRTNLNSSKGRETNLVRPIFTMTTDDFSKVRIYTANMLEIYLTPTHHPRLLLRGVRAPAWIVHRPSPNGGSDWQLWIKRKGRMTSAKCPLRLEIESR